MPDNKLTDNEIIKALECCGKYNVTHQDRYCNDCVFKGRGRCRARLIDNIIGFINRLQAENESLQRRLHNAKLHQKETHKALQDEKALRLNEDVIKAEAYKEFAERLKEKKIELDDQNEDIFYAVEVADIDNLLREMVGDEK